MYVRGPCNLQIGSNESFPLFGISTTCVCHHCRVNVECTMRVGSSVETLPPWWATQTELFVYGARWYCADGEASEGRVVRGWSEEPHWLRNSLSVVVIIVIIIIVIGVVNSM